MSVSRPIEHYNKPKILLLDPDSFHMPPQYYQEEPLGVVFITHNVILNHFLEDIYVTPH